ncbi:MAG: UvrB/UvrC motif-containing protein [Verrucomicrobia bacterium]|nr:UvrB/UvrC motif-containing protein [Verrucomicrobiota bacterium]
MIKLFCNAPFGPFAHSGALRTTINWMNREFGLRSCRPMRPGEHDYKHCNDDIIKNCTAPCIGKIERAAYLTRVDNACSFLDGQSKETVAALEQEMQSAAAKLDFERAAELRDMLDSFRKTLAPKRKFNRGRGVPSAINPVDDVKELQEVLRMDTLPAIMECFDISNISTTHCVASMVRFKNGEPDNHNYRRYRIKTVKGQNDFASMAEVVRRRYSRILLEAREAEPETADATQEDPLEALRRIGESLEGRSKGKGSSGRFVRLPDLVIVDGGKGQLSSAMGEMKRLGLHDLPLIGLAKEFEEIYRPGVSEPLILPHDMGALRLLQRIPAGFAPRTTGYHQLLMKRRIDESVLDDCPGISQSRKQVLLKVFGSVARLRKMSIDDLAAVNGISSKLAAEIVQFLKTH